MNAESWDRGQKTFALMVFVTFVGAQLVQPFLPLYVQALGIEDIGAAALWSGLLFCMPPFVSAFTVPMWGVIGDRHGHKLAIEVVLAGFGVITILMAFVRNVLELLLLRVVTGLFGGFLVIATTN